MNEQLELFAPAVEEPPAKVLYEPDPFFVGEYAIVAEICADGYFLWERCYVHEVLPDGYRVEICEGIVWGRPWHKDGTMITVSRTGLSRYRPESFYNQGAHWVPTIDFFYSKTRLHLRYALSFSIETLLQKTFSGEGKK